MISEISEYSKPEISEIIILTRLSLYNQNMFCGAHAIRKVLKGLNIRPLPSVSTIGRILSRNGLTYKKTGFY
ncbi:MAG: hypothetical protein GY781_06200 [Gammaproteobacteria bacterium]|nr:hypothetical protein [Gammaproteobacteria bacterium]